jgi:hypothetical protein
MAELIYPKVLVSKRILRGSNGMYYVPVYKPNFQEIAQSKRESIPIFSSNEIKMNPKQTIYTWIIGPLQNGKLKFWAKECLNEYETLTKHLHILHDSKCGQQVGRVGEDCIIDVVYAGELLVPAIGSDVPARFNFSSGTFGVEVEKQGPEIIKMIKDLMSEGLEGVEMEFVADYATFIEKSPDHEVIVQLRSSGIFDLYEFDDEKSATEFSEAEIAIIILEEQIKLVLKMIHRFKLTKETEPELIELASKKAKIERLQGLLESKRILGGTRRVKKNKKSFKRFAYKQK